MTEIKIDNELVQSQADMVRENPGMSITAHLAGYDTPEMLEFLDMTREELPEQMAHDFAHFNAAEDRGLIYIESVEGDLRAYPVPPCPGCGQRAVRLYDDWFACPHEDNGRKFHFRRTP